MAKKKKIPVHVTKGRSGTQQVAWVKDFFDMISPSTIKFFTDYFICGDTFRCVWAFREYPPQTTDQAILCRFGDKESVTLHIYSHYVDNGEQRKIIQNATRKNKMMSTLNDVQESITAEGNMDDVVTLLSEIQTMADEIIREGAAQTKSGSFVLGFDELSERFDTPIDRGNYFGEALAAELKTRDALSDVITDESGITLTFAEQTAWPSLTVRQLMAGNLTYVHLLDNDEEHDLATIVELNPDTLTVQGMADWADVLDAKVESIATGYYGLQVNVSGCSPERLKDFSFMLAGQCPLSDYEKWINPDDGETFEMKWSDKT